MRLLETAQPPASQSKRTKPIRECASLYRGKRLAVLCRRPQDENRFPSSPGRFALYRDTGGACLRKPAEFCRKKCLKPAELFQIFEVQRFFQSTPPQGGWSGYLLAVSGMSTRVRPPSAHEPRHPRREYDSSGHRRSQKRDIAPSLSARLLAGVVSTSTPGVPRQVPGKTALPGIPP